MKKIITETFFLFNNNFRTLSKTAIPFLFTISMTGYCSEGNYTDTWNMNVAPGSEPVPEPTTMLLFGTGLAGLAGKKIRRKKKA